MNPILNLLQFGSQEFLDEFKRSLNEDGEFRRLGEESSYTATELVLIPEVEYAYYQNTQNGLIEELRLVNPKDIGSVQKKVDLVYEIGKYESLLKLVRGQSTPLKLVITGKMKVKGGRADKALKHYSSISRAMNLLSKMYAEGALMLPEKPEDFTAEMARRRGKK